MSDPGIQDLKPSICPLSLSISFFAWLSDLAFLHWCNLGWRWIMCDI